jgi:glucokinase
MVDLESAPGASQPRPHSGRDRTEHEILRILHGTGAQSVRQIVRRLDAHGFPRKAATVNARLEALAASRPPLVRRDRDPAAFHLPKPGGTTIPGPKVWWANLSHHWGFVVGVDVGNLVIRSAVTTMDAWPLGGSQAHIEVATSEPSEALREIGGCIERAVAEAARRDRTFDRSLLRGVAVALPAPVTPNGVSASILPGWTEIDIRAELREWLPGDLAHLDIAIFNEADARIVGEARVGAARDDDDIVLLKVSHGIGGGAIHDSQLLGRGSATEIGHMRVDPALVTTQRAGANVRGLAPKVRCACGGSNHLQAFASFKAMAARLGLSQTDPHDQEAVYDRITSEWRSDDDFKLVVRQSCELLAQALTTVCAVLDPRVIVIGGRLANCGPAVLPCIRSKMQLSGIGGTPSFILGTTKPAVGDEALQPWIGVRGAARMAIETFVTIDAPPAA